MPRYSDSSKERVRDASDFVAIVSARTDLRRSGPNRYMGLCPFHEERTPSFHVEPQQKVYHCFGCGASGDLFTFVMETENLDFTAALEALADRAGMQLEPVEEDPRSAERRKRSERLRELLQRTSEFYERLLWESEEGAPARQYLEERGLEVEQLKKFGVGYAPSAWDKVLLGSRRAGFSEEELLAAGIAQRSRSQEGRLYDRFRRRIMFPLRDQRGRVLGFGARALSPDQQPKYVNSPESEVYHKGRHLYATDLARAAAAKADCTILVEGYTDVIALHQAGIENVVGLMGTALTDDQIGELARLGGRVDLSLDADSAGQRAMLKAAESARRRNLELRVVSMPQGKDPAELAQELDPEELTKLFDSAIPFATFRVERILAYDLSDVSIRDRALGALREVIAPLPTSALKVELVKAVANSLDLSEQMAQSLIESAPQAVVSASTVQPLQGGRSPQRDPVAARSEVEISFLAHCVALPTEGKEALSRVDVQQHFTSALARRAAEHLSENLANPLAGLPAEDTELASLVAELVVRAGEVPTSQQAIEVSLLQLEKARLEREIRAATRDGAPGISKLAGERENVQGRLDAALSERRI